MNQEKINKLRLLPNKARELCGLINIFNIYVETEYKLCSFYTNDMGSQALKQFFNEYDSNFKFKGSWINIIES